MSAFHGAREPGYARPMKSAGDVAQGGILGQRFAGCGARVMVL